MNAQLRKAAILIVSLDRSSAESLLAQMPKEFAKRVLAAAKQLGKVDPAEQQAVMRDFLARKETQAEPVSAAASSDVELSLSMQAATDSNASASAKEETDAPIAKWSGGSDSTRRFDFVTDALAKPLAFILSREQPRLAALILAHLPAERSAMVLAELELVCRLAIVESIADIEDTAPEVLDELEQELKIRVLREQLKLEGSRQGLAALSGILQASDPELRSQISTAMAARRAEGVAATSASKVVQAPIQVEPKLPIRKEASFDQTPPVAAPVLAFSGFSLLDDISLAAVFGSVSPQTALLALVGADEKLVRRILGVLPRKDAAVFRKRLEEVGPLRLKEVEQAQFRLSEAADELLEQRRITLPVPERARVAA